jgi:hypothetical protein
LTVGESEGFAVLGGIINFTVEDNKVHFEINRLAADRAGLEIGSRLLSIAKIVKEHSRGKEELKPSGVTWTVPTHQRSLLSGLPLFRRAWPGHPLTFRRSQTSSLDTWPIEIT